MSSEKHQGPDAGGPVLTLWGMLAVLVILAVVLIFMGQMTIGVALVAVAISLSAVAVNAGKKTPGDQG